MRLSGSLFAIPFVLAGCAAPQLVAPPNNPNPVVLPQVETSVINIPINLDLETLRRETLKSAPKPLSKGTVNQSLGIATAAVSHEVNLTDMSLVLAGQQFTAKAQLDFSLDTRLNSGLLNLGNLSCGVGNEEKPRIEFTLPGSLYWTTTGDLAIQPDPWQLRWIKPCNISAFKIQADKLLNLPFVRDKVQGLITDSIADGLKQVGLKAMISRTWPKLNEPVAVEKGVWLLMNPQSIGLADIKGNGRSVQTAVSVQARPQLVSGDKPKVVVPPVPQPQRLSSQAEGFHLALWGDIGLDTANGLLNETLAGKPFDAGGKTVLIDSLRLYGNGDKAVIGIKLQQPINAEVYLLGKPVFDVAANEFRLEDVEFDLSTSSFLAKSANWMLHGTLRDTIQQKARFRFDKDLESQLKDFQDYRQDLGYGATLRAQVESVRPQGLFFTPNEIKALVLVDGKLSVESPTTAPAVVK